ncbi:hypothetical protein J7E63_27165 [Bacillus sp. ISL-75]|uniref:hypothetical protein n=1 Tax=Bacillus sp. ISL-75 TaxID=2819137 RepID=UPI001BEC9F96|nr:hypothetical protein [Bacillus sp. ISL-75]MBT2730511.1 hypothetical protein [Bacillus sp. ISL-75]
MLGTWNTVVQTPFAKMKFVFVVEKEDQYTFSVKEPAQLNMLFQSVKVEGEQLHAKGKYILLLEEAAEITLTFREDSFNGSLNLHSLGNLQIQGEKGEGTH